MSSGWFEDDPDMRRLYEDNQFGQTDPSPAPNFETGTVPPPKPYNPTDPHPVETPYSPPPNQTPSFGSSGPGGVDLNTGKPIMSAAAPAPTSPYFTDNAFNGDYQGYFNSLFPNAEAGGLTAAMLKAKEAELNRAGIHLHASTSNDNIDVPGIGLVDVIQGAGELNKRAWQPPGPSGGGGSPLPNPPAFGPIGGGLPSGMSDISKSLNGSYQKLIDSSQATIDHPIDNAQFEALRQPIDKARRTANNSATAVLADRGMLNGSGELANFTGRLEGQLAPDFATAVQNASVQNTQGARQSLLSGLQGQSSLQGIMGDLALRNLDENRLWNQFLATYGLDRARVQALIDQGYGDQILKLFETQAGGAY